MILRRLGNKKKLANKILTYFPKHDVYIEPFFGAGGMFFNKPKAKFNIVNDLDSDVFNLFQVVSNKKKELEDAWIRTPVHADLLDYWKKNKETDPIKKAVRFLFLSNLTFLGKMKTLRSSPDNSKKILYQNIQKSNDVLVDVKFFNKDFRKFLKSLSLKSEKRNLINKTFIYADSPYLETENNYTDCAVWTEKDSEDLFNCLEYIGCKWAMSEFDHPFILQQAKVRGLNMIKLGKRKNLNNFRDEILITNYDNKQISLL